MSTSLSNGSSEYPPRMYVVSLSKTGCLYVSGTDSSPLGMPTTGIRAPALQSASRPHIVAMCRVSAKSPLPYRAAMTRQQALG